MSGITQENDERHLKVAGLMTKDGTQDLLTSITRINQSGVTCGKNCVVMS